MDKKELGRFYATSFDDKKYEFIVFDNNTMDCPTLNINSIEQIELKPRFVLWGKDFHYKCDSKAPRRNVSAPGLIANYAIDEDLFRYMHSNGMLRYSIDMAFLYGFSDKLGYDRSDYGIGRRYKWAKKKGPILVKQRKGQFN